MQTHRKLPSYHGEFPCTIQSISPTSYILYSSTVQQACQTPGRWTACLAGREFDMLAVQYQEQELDIDTMCMYMFFAILLHL